MNVKEIIEILKTMPQDQEVWHIWDGSARTTIDHIWLSRGGRVMTAESGEVVYNQDNRPVHAPNDTESPYWETPFDNGEMDEKPLKQD